MSDKSFGSRSRGYLMKSQAVIDELVRQSGIKDAEIALLRSQSTNDFHYLPSTELLVDYSIFL